MFKIGDKVIDDDGRKGVVVASDSIHNIEVEYEGKYIGSGLYCVDKKCVEFDRLKLRTTDKGQNNDTICVGASTCGGCVGTECPAHK